MSRLLRRLAAALLVMLLLALAILAAVGSLARFEMAAVPGEDALLDSARLPVEAAYDVLGRSISPAEASTLLATPEGRAALSPAAGAVRIDEALLREGREAFYGETFGNERYLGDVLGLLDGGLSPFGVAPAIAALGGRPTGDLEIRLARDVEAGDRRWRAGEVVRTGLDVPAGGYLPLGIRLFYDRGSVRAGITCALCHARIDPATGRVVEGAPNADLNLGLILALARNPAAVLPQTGIASLKPFQTRPELFLRRSTGGSDLLPDPRALAGAVRATLASWPPGSVDTTGDLVANPTSIPSVFTRDGWPYGWSGQAAIGPFRGLAFLSDMVHGLGMDASALAPAAQARFGLDPETWLATLLGDAPAPDPRFDPATGVDPSEVLAKADPTPGVPGLGRFVALPGLVRANYVTASGLIPVRDGAPVGRPQFALAAFINTLRPPPVPAAASAERGREVFVRAGCAACHTGPALASHRVWPAEVIGTEPSRAAAFARLEADAARPQIFAADTPHPLPAEPKLVPVPVPDEGQLKLGWGHNATRGGYKVPGLVGLAWTAPYLHDGGVAVGPDPERRPGADAPADPRNSLRALVDRAVRGTVVAANAASPSLAAVRVTGAGHAFWADREAGFAEEEREALLDYLLQIDAPGRP